MGRSHASIATFAFGAQTAQLMAKIPSQLSAETADFIFQRQLEITNKFAVQIHQVIVDLKRDPRPQDKFKLAHLQKKLRAYQLLAKVFSSNAARMTQHVFEHDIHTLQGKVFQEMTLCLALMETAFKRMLSLPSDFYQKQFTKTNTLIFKARQSSMEFSKWVGGTGIGVASFLTPCCALGVMVALGAKALLCATVGLVIMTVDISIHNVSQRGLSLWPSSNQQDKTNEKEHMREDLKQALGDMRQIFTLEFCELTSVPKDPCMVCLRYFEKSEEAKDICCQGRHFMHKACMKKFYQRHHCLLCPMCGL